MREPYSDCGVNYFGPRGAPTFVSRFLAVIGHRTGSLGLTAERRQTAHDAPRFRGGGMRVFWRDGTSPLHEKSQVRKPDEYIANLRYRAGLVFSPAGTTSQSDAP